MEVVESHSGVTWRIPQAIIRDATSPSYTTSLETCYPVARARSIDIPPCGFLYVQDSHGEVLVLRHWMHDVQNQSN